MHSEGGPHRRIVRTARDFAYKNANAILRMRVALMQSEVALLSSPVRAVTYLAWEYEYEEVFLAVAVFKELMLAEGIPLHSSVRAIAYITLEIVPAGVRMLSAFMPPALMDLQGIRYRPDVRTVGHVTREVATAIVGVLGSEACFEASLLSGYLVHRVSKTGITSHGDRAYLTTFACSATAAEYESKPLTPCRNNQVRSVDATNCCPLA
eukprot:gnl/TRDRNA2_/TRDRNA2_172982_c3_seq8.p2 gnl/TRDRNA2_/TRDRNA2_172982_c3~~gnl/TRDRNA2_/TRDRNA2_172982_c3_seq8.p2  ORF type:complete len:209 (+),score=7.51 gnl/TRDRNA2_/TRDRNA2_172982_c3_seq8:616-1242(+)